MFNQFYKISLILIAALMLGMVTFEPAYASSSAEEVPEDGPVYLKLKPITAPVWKNGRVRYNIFLTLNLEFSDDDKKEIVRKRLPKIRNAFLLEVHDKSILYKDDKRGIDFVRLRKRLMASAEKAVGKDMVRDILVVEAFSGK